MATVYHGPKGSLTDHDLLVAGQDGRIIQAGMSLEEAIVNAANMIGTNEMPVDLDKLKSFDDLMAVLKMSGVQISIPEGKEGFKYATNEFRKENAHKYTVLGHVLNGEDDE